MRANIRMATTDDIMLAKLQRDLEIKKRDIQANLDDEDMTFIAYCVLFGFVLTGILLILVLA
jgi:hypothetical protein